MGESIEVPFLLYSVHITWQRLRSKEPAKAGLIDGFTEHVTNQHTRFTCTGEGL
jgi:2-phosphoglycerate kinase